MLKIQLALDRFTISQAVSIAKEVSEFIDWIEVGTSLIKEFGTESIVAIRRAFPDKIVVADIKTFDNAEYEMNLCFDAGADVATVLGVASKVTIEKCIQTAKKRNAKVMIDFASVPIEKQSTMPVHNNVIWCLHTSKDEQEALNVKQDGTLASKVLSMPERPNLAVAGGITAESVSVLSKLMPEVIIAGSYITKAEDRRLSAEKLRNAVRQLEMK